MAAKEKASSIMVEQPEGRVLGCESASGHNETPTRIILDKLFSHEFLGPKKGTNKTERPKTAYVRSFRWEAHTPLEFSFEMFHPISCRMSKLLMSCPHLTKMSLLNNPRSWIHSSRVYVP